MVRGSAEKRIPLIAKDIGADSVHISEDFTPFGRRRDEQVRKALADVPLVATGSPYLVSPGRVVKDDESPYKVYADVLNHWPRSAWWNWNTDFDAIETDSGADAEKLFEAWKSGRTGFPIVDAGMRQLSETGVMHNRVRMIVASFLVKDLHLPWQWGARWFLEQLVDGDMASNQHGWQWCAGSGTDAAPYFRVFNPTTQGQKFDPAGDYIRRWSPEIVDADDPHLKNGQGHPGYPEPVVDHGHERTEALRRYRVLTGK